MTARKEPEITAVSLKVYEEAGRDIFKALMAQKIPEEKAPLPESPSSLPRIRRLEKRRKKPMAETKDKERIGQESLYGTENLLGLVTDSFIDDVVKGAKRKQKKTQNLLYDSQLPAALAVSDEEAEFEIKGPRFVMYKTGRIFPIKGEEMSIGHSSKCDMVIPEERRPRTVSRNHAVCIVKDGRVFIKDDSTNGTYLSSTTKRPGGWMRIPKGNEVELIDRQFVKFATVTFQFIKGD